MPVASRLSHMHLQIDGAGVVGLTLAFEALRAGAAVTVIDPHPPEESASWAAAGLLAPAFETLTRPDLHARLPELCLRSAALWPGFAAALESFSRAPLSYAAGPSFALGLTHETRAALDRLDGARLARGWPGARLTAAEAAAQLPGVASEVSGAVRLDTDGQVDPRALMQALRAAIAALGGTFAAAPERAADATVLARGWRSGPVQPVRGQMLALSRVDGVPDVPLHHGALYVAPKPDRILIGATFEPGISERATEPAALEALRARAVALVPALADARVVDQWSGIRAVRGDGAPLIGRLADGRWIGTGHSRNGILLAPVTAEILLEALEGEAPDALAAAFRPPPGIEALV